MEPTTTTTKKLNDTQNSIHDMITVIFIVNVPIVLKVTHQIMMDIFVIPSVCGFLLDIWGGAIRIW